MSCWVKISPGVHTLKYALPLIQYNYLGGKIIIFVMLTEIMSEKQEKRIPQHPFERQNILLFLNKRYGRSPFCS